MFNLCEGGSEGGSMDAEPLLPGAAPAGVADYHGRPVSRSVSGGWIPAVFIIGVEVAERFAYYGISLNLINYLTGHLHESTAAAASAVNAWSGVSFMLPLLGAFIADSYLGRYRMVVAASLVYVLGLGMLTLSTVLPTFYPAECKKAADPTTCRPSHFQATFFYISLYLVAFAQGGHKPCVQAFGADQFDQNDPKECRSRSSFFNWWYFSMNTGIVASLLIMTYIQDNISWSLGFGIPCIFMVIALIVFLFGTKTYRFCPVEDNSPFIRIGKTFITMARRQVYGNAQTTMSGEAEEACQYESSKSELAHGSHCTYEADEDVDTASVLQFEEAKGVLRLFPIWASCLMYAIVFAQSSTFFTKQGSTMDRRIGSSLLLPSAALQSFIPGTIVAFIPIYDRALVPVTRNLFGISSGITMLQRIGIGILTSVIAMVVAALVEMKRLKVAEDLGLVDLPDAVIPMSLWWLVPQYVLYGISDVFTIVGLQEFFYDQVPDSLRSLGLALYLSVLGIGSFLSSFIISIIDKATSRTGESWFSDNLNHGHLDYFYWLLALLSVIMLVLYFYSAQSYVYKKKSSGAM